MPAPQTSTTLLKYVGTDPVRTSTTSAPKSRMARCSRLTIRNTGRTGIPTKKGLSCLQNGVSCKEEMENCRFRGRRLALIDPVSGLSAYDLAAADPDGNDGIMAEAFAPYVGRPQGPSIFTEIPRPKKGTKK